MVDRTESKAAPPASAGLRSMPTTVIALGFVSLCMDTSSEIIHSLLPAFLVTVLGANGLSIGIIEGVAEATTSISRIFSGAISDWLGKRKLLVLIGYGLAAITKPLFPLATGVGMVFVARFVDRIGKGIRGAPRDALIADVTPLALRGTAFGLRQSMDTVGAFLGPLFAMVIMFTSGEDFRFAFWMAVIPAALAVLLIVYGVREPAGLQDAKRRGFPMRRTEFARLGHEYWWLVGIASVLTLARFSEAFLLLAGQQAGMAIALIPIILVIMNITYATSAYPFGRLADCMSRRILLVMGITLLIAADVVLATSETVWQVMLGAAVWGVHMGATQGLLSAIIADTVPADLRGTAFGFYSLVTGAALLAASVVAGLLWTAVGPTATFAAGAVFAAMAMIGVALQQTLIKQ
jgi:MFS family permease